MYCFDKAEELLEFATQGYTVLYAMDICNIKDLAQIPEDLPSTVEEKVLYRDKLAERIVSEIYQAPKYFRGIAS